MNKMQTCVKQRTVQTEQVDVILLRIDGTNVNDRDFIVARISWQDINKL